ncbi:30S ribosomal protein S12 methylthiotransferase RimO [Thermicanus aegyptius]|uniref:30S ribosomal protein S12 methylthiotransferase RimO n=1 Tax=Thermicanus aegyptius TaxID=94009 RepID=UPI0003F54A61|nr:30S ribosomal protein S12 methylthiotransferase RimO [Thermicanus aegyptius]
MQQKHGEEKVAIVTLGCEKNKVDSEIMSDLIDRKGYQLVDRPEEATVVIVNTCGFIDAAKEESIDTILEVARLKGHGQLKSLIVAGCLTERYQEILLQEMPEIDGLVGTGNIDKITAVIEESLAGRHPVYVGNPAFSYENISRKRREKRASAFVKIAEGCNNQCTFCAIPIMRGKLRSRTIASVTREVRQLVEEGVKEVSLIAQDLSNYGVDLTGRSLLPDLLRSLQEIPQLSWIRLHYLYPGAFSDELLETMATCDKVVPYADIPLQHSEDSILRRMRRPGYQTDIRNLLRRIRDRIPDVAIRTSIIVGFPGETEEDFENLLSFIKEVKFDRLGVFTYSQEEGTPAARLKEQVADEVKEERAGRLMEIQRRITAERNSRFVGRILPVLVEKKDEKNGVYIGRTPYDAVEVDGEVYLTGYRGDVGEIIPVRITHSYDYDLAGVAINR